MQKIACSNSAEVSCLLANLLAELEQPCRMCRPDGVVVLTGRSPMGEAVTVRLLPDCIMEVEGCDELLSTVRERRCPYGR